MQRELDKRYNNVEEHIVCKLYSDFLFLRNIEFLVVFLSKVHYLNRKNFGLGEHNQFCFVMVTINTTAINSIRI